MHPKEPKHLEMCQYLKFCTVFPASKGLHLTVVFPSPFCLSNSDCNPDLTACSDCLHALRKGWFWFWLCFFFRMG